MIKTKPCRWGLNRSSSCIASTVLRWFDSVYHFRSTQVSWIWAKCFFPFRPLLLSNCGKNALFLGLGQFELWASHQRSEVLGNWWDCSESRGRRKWANSSWNESAAPARLAAALGYCLTVVKEPVGTCSSSQRQDCPLQVRHALSKLACAGVLRRYQPLRLHLSTRRAGVWTQFRIHCLPPLISPR